MNVAKELLIQAGLHESVWGKRIITAEQDNGFNDRDRILTCSWLTCACGEHAKEVELNPNGGPRDWDLRRLGLDFMGHIRRNRYKDAVKTLTAVEERVGQLLRR